MKYSSISLFFLLASFACGQQENINASVDEKLEGLNKLHTRNDLGLISLRSGRFNGTSFGSGVLLGANSMRRSGDALVEREGRNSSRVSLGLSFRLLLFAFSSVRAGTFEGSVYLRPRDNRLDLHFTIHRQPDCRVSVEEFAFTRMDDVDLETSSDINDEALEQLRSTFLPYINKILDQSRGELLSNLYFLCWE